MIKILVKMTMVICELFGRKVYIYGRTKNGSPSPDVYLVRWKVFKNKYFCLYIHRFLRSDADTHHDHPWDFYTYVVDGNYTEELLTKRGNGYLTQIVYRDTGSIVKRFSTDIHRVIVDEDRKISDLNNAPLTICFIGRKKREWGFWPKTSRKGLITYRKFKHWKEFLGTEVSEVSASE